MGPFKRLPLPPSPRPRWRYRPHVIWRESGQITGNNDGGVLSPLGRRPLGLQTKGDLSTCCKGPGCKIWEVTAAGGGAVTSQ